MNVFVGSALVHACLKFGLMEEAHEMFEGLPMKDVVLWNALVNGYSSLPTAGAKHFCRIRGDNHGVECWGIFNSHQFQRVMGLWQ
jgi:hypothetical protein